MAGPRLTREWLDSTKKKLAALPPPRPDTFTRQEVIIELAPIIRSMQAKKYRLEDILPVLNEGEGGFTVASVKTYLARASKSGSEVSQSSRTPKKGAGQGDTEAGKKVSDQVSNQGTSGVHDGSRLRAPVPPGDTL